MVPATKIDETERAREGIDPANSGSASENSSKRDRGSLGNRLIAILRDWIVYKTVEYLANAFATMSNRGSGGWGVGGGR